jgi:hypothetical protein
MVELSALQYRRIREALREKDSELVSGEREEQIRVRVGIADG